MVITYILTKVSTEGLNQYLDFLIDPSFQRVNILFVLLFENEVDRKVHTGYYLPKVEIKDYIVMIDAKNFFEQPVKSDLRTYDNIRKISTRSTRWLHNWLFARLLLFQKIL